jgi:hypothetical protein
MSVKLLAENVEAREGRDPRSSSNGTEPIPALSAPSKPRLSCTHLVRLRGALARRALAGEVRCPAGLGSQPSHSGGAGAPPGPKMRSCQELADDRKVYSKRDRSPPSGRLKPEAGHLRRKRGPVVAKSSPLARQEAPAVVPKGSRSHRIALFGAPSPLMPRGLHVRREVLACLPPPARGRVGVGVNDESPTPRGPPPPTTRPPPGALKARRPPPFRGRNK